MRYLGPPSRYFEKTVKLDDGAEINWNDYHYRMLIDAPYIKRMVIRSSRQVGKTIFVSMLGVKFAHIPMFRIVYVSPSQKQTDEFSKLKFGKILNTNPELKRLLLSHKSPIAVSRNMDAHSVSNDVYLKTFSTGATMKLGYANDAAGVEKLRGGSADALIKDESQSMDLKPINNILDPMLNSSKYRIDINTGTPIDPDDDLCKLFETTSQHTMVVKCTHCNKFTLLTHLKQIGREHVLCYHCLKPVDIRTGKFVPMNPSAKIFGIHFNPLMMPGVVFNKINYQDLVNKVYAPDRDENALYNEQMGIPKGTAATMVSETDVDNCRSSRIRYTPDDFNAVLTKYKLMPKYGHTLVAAIDWGGGAEDQGNDSAGKSHTAFVLLDIYLEGNDFTIDVIYHKLYPLPDVKLCIEDVLAKVRELPPGTHVATDYMGGAYANSTIFSYARLGQKITVLPVRFAQLLKLVDIVEDQYRVDVDKSFAVSKFIKKKVLDQRVHFSGEQGVIKEIKESIMSMKTVSYAREPGVIRWLLKSNRTNDIMMAIIIGWVSYCVKQKVMHDLVL